jgi:uncharacterized membrane protein YdfJ with MMPL/SSD domain
MLTKFGGFLYRRRIVALFVTIAVVIGATVFGLGLFGSLSNTVIGVENSESGQATDLLRSKLGDSGTDVIILLKSNTLSATDPTFTQAATSLLSALNTRPEVASLTSYYSTKSPDFISRDGHETFAILRLKGNDITTKQNGYTSLQPRLTSPILQVTVGGFIPANIALTEQATQDLQLAESVTLPILLLLLLLVFGGVIAACLPLFIGVIAILITCAVLRGLTTITTISIYAINVVTLLGLGLTIDYSLFILSRFREELAHNQQDVGTALERTMATAGRTVIYSGLTVSTSLLSLLLFPVIFVRSIGLGAISAVLMAMLASLTLLPIVLALLGPRVNALSLRRFIRSRRALRTSTNAGEQQGVWYRLSEMIMRKPIPVFLIVSVFLLLLVIPFFNIKLANTDSNLLPPENEARVVSQRLSQDFAHQGNAQLIIAITTPGDALSPENLARLDSYVKSIQTVPGVVQVQSLVTVSPNLNLSAYQQLYAHPELDPQLAQIANQLANDDFTEVMVGIQPTDHTSAASTLAKQIRALHVPDGLTARVTGSTPIEIDLLASIAAILPEAFLVIFASIFVLLFLMTGSLIMPLKAIILNMLSLSATFGGLVWIFQDGHLQEILHFHSLGSIDATEPVILFALAFGLSMDYEVFVLSRIKERFDATGNNRQAVSSGIQNTGWLVTSAALLMGIVFGGFGLAKTISLQEIGIGLAIAVLMDATLIRMLLLPATMRLLGTLNWWAPAPLRWLWKYIGLKEAEATPALAFHMQTGRDRTETSPIRPLPLRMDGVKAALQDGDNVISTRTANGEEIMGSEILLWHYPEKHIVNGSRLSVGSNQFCVLKVNGSILDVYETGEYGVRTPNSPSFDLVQLTFDDEPITVEYEALYINRAQLVSQVSGVARSRERGEVDYSVDLSIYVVTREDALRLVQGMHYRGHTLSIQDINAYVRPVIEQTVNQLVQTTSPVLAPEQRLQMQDFSPLLHEQLQLFLSTYGITVDEVKARVVPHYEVMTAPLSLKDFDLSKLGALRDYVVTDDHVNNRHLKAYLEEVEQKIHMIWQNRLDHYSDKIAAIQSELEKTRADFSLRMDAHCARLQELSRAMSSELQEEGSNVVTQEGGKPRPFK